MKANKLVSIFDNCVEDYHKFDDVNQQIANPYPSKSFKEILYRKCWIDTVQWHYEDIIRDDKIKPKEAVIDFVGEKGSTAMGIQMTSNGGFYYIVGYGEEIKSLAVDLIISEKTIVGNLVGTWSELYELMELADRGKVKLSMQEYKLDDANKALHDLNDGKVKGRAVLVP